MKDEKNFVGVVVAQLNINYTIYALDCITIYNIQAYNNNTVTVRYDCML